MRVRSLIIASVSGDSTEIPQVIIMTMVDRACPLVMMDLSKIYTSRKIKEKVRTSAAAISSSFYLLPVHLLWYFSAV